ncbi:MAG: hypothetical protein MJ102_07580 [Clostridia bacterium]|nr:hypothetical protein [Clostridia bacterium]
MNKLSVKITAFTLCAILCLSGVITAFALAGDKNEEPQKKLTAASVENDENEITKDETVYVLAGADGSVKKIIVSDWIKNALGAASLTDTTGLSDIENVKGDESYTINGNAKVWDAQGNDIYYQGNIEKELPVGMTVTYTLDGKKVSVDEIAGKTGKVSIRFDYDNRQYETVKIDGKDEKIYVPFAMLTGMLLDNDCFRNVKVSNGKLINDGDRTAVVGIALPGLQENLGIGKDKIDIPDYVEITADATDFSFGMTVTIATNEIFNNLDTSKFDSVDGLAGSIGELTDGMNQLLDGSSALYGGLCTLLEKSDELVSGIGQLADGAKALKDGAIALDDGAGQLKAGAAELAGGLNTLKDNNATLNGGAKQVFETLLSTAETQIKAGGISVPTLTIDNYAKVLDGVIASLDETSVYNQALAQVTAAARENRPLIVQKVTAAVREQAEAQVIAAVQEQVSAGVASAVREQVADQVISTATGMNKSDYEAAVSAGLIPEETQNAVSAAIDAQMQSDDVKALIEANITAKMASEEIKATIKANTDAQMQTDTVQKTISDNVELQVKQAISENMASDEVQSKLAAASEGAKSIISLKTSLDSYNAFYLGLLTYTGGVASAADGAGKLASGASDLKDGAAQLKDGASALYDGILQLKNGTPALVDGVTGLKDGAMQLNEGLQKFNEEGIQKIIDLVDGDLNGIVARLKATIDVSKNYRNFAGISDDMDGQVKFIYRTDEIKE